MATQGFNNNGTQAGAAWTNPSNAASVNGSVASNNANPPSGTLTLTNYGFTIPAGVIDGIELEITACQNSGLAEPDYSLRTQLTKDGSAGVGSTVDTGMNGTPLGTSTAGGATSLWGTTWTPAEVNASTFGVIAQYQGDVGNTNEFYIDCIRIKIYYTATGGGSAIATGSFVVRRPAINVRN